MIQGRVVFIDLLRGWAGLVMIEVHVINAFVITEVRSADWFPALNFMNGLVAPSFLFVAGLVFVVVSERKLPEFREYGGVFWKQIGRILLIWAVGYFLHLPIFSFSRTLHGTTPEDWLKFFQADILHCIAAGLLTLFIVRLFVKRNHMFERILWGSVALVVLSAPFLWETDFNTFVHPFLGAYMNGQHYSQFPLFPWLGFLFVGGIVGVRYSRARTEQRELSFMKSVFWWGAGSVVIVLLMGDHFPIPGASTEIRPQPVFFVLRMGIVLLLLAGFWWFEQVRKTENSFVLGVSRETLLVYAAHLLIIYGTFWNEKSLADSYGRSLSFGEGLAATLGLAAVMIVVAELWGRIKKKSRPLARNLSLAGAAVVLVIFLVK